MACAGTTHNLAGTTTQDMIEGCKVALHLLLDKLIFAGCDGPDTQGAS
jgi:hypothetical protein